MKAPTEEGLRDELISIIDEDNRRRAEEIQQLLMSFGVSATLVQVRLTSDVTEVGVAISSSELESVRDLMATIMTEATKEIG